MAELIPGKYQHYKGDFYEVFWVALDSDTLEEDVVYRALYDSKDFGPIQKWTRAKKNWETPEIIDGKPVERYRYVGPIEK